MSDALTDIARDTRRAEVFGEYLEAVKAYLLDSSQETFKNAVEAAQVVDGVPRGYWGGRTSLSKDIEKRLRSLKRGNKQEWARFLSLVMRYDISYRHLFEEFKAISPFKDKLLVHVDYGCGFVHFGGEIEAFFAKIIREHAGWKTYDADDYFVALPMPEINEDTEVIWLHCGILGVKGPREVVKKSIDKGQVK